MSQNVKINDTGKMFSWPVRIALAGRIEASRNDLIQKLGNPVDISIFDKIDTDYNIFTPTIDTTTTFWSLEFDKDTLVTIYDNANETSNNWYVATNTLLAASKIEDFLKTKLLPVNLPQ